MVGKRDKGARGYTKIGRGERIRAKKKIAANFSVLFF